MSSGDPSYRALTRLEASIKGESALIDRELGRVLWESGGSRSTLSASVAPKLDEIGAHHVKAKILTSILLIGLMGCFLRWMQSRLYRTAIADKVAKLYMIGSFLVFLSRTMMKWVPQFNVWFLVVVWVLYMIEAYTCSTRDYLSHATCRPDDIESYLRKLRSEQPRVTWTVRCFHYEGYSWQSNIWQVFSALRRKPVKNVGTDRDANTTEDTSSPSPAAPGRLSRKVITCQASQSYQIQHWLDKTIAGVWKRASAVSSSGVPFTKLTLSKLLVLSDCKTRQDYMAQQSKFVTEFGQGDEFAEFSTDIQVPGFQPRMLFVRPESSKMLRQSTFWICTILFLTVPYRIWFSNHCDEIRVTVVKEAYVAPLRRDEGSKQGWLSFFSSHGRTNAIVEDETFGSMLREIRILEDSNDPSTALQQELPHEQLSSQPFHAVLPPPFNTTISSANVTMKDDQVDEGSGADDSS